MREFFDIVVVGAGPAGVAAAVTAAEAGQRAALVDDNPAPGGQIWRSGAHLPRAGLHWLARLQRSSARRLNGWRVFDSPQPDLLCAEPCQFVPSAHNGSASTAQVTRAELRFNRLILATGARERFLPFPGWTLPNVMGAGALDALVRSGLPIAQKRVVVAGTGPLLLAVAAHLARRGARIVAVCEQASFSQIARFAARLVFEPAKLAQGASYALAMRSAHVHTGCWPIAAHGPDRLHSVTLRKGDDLWDVDCDYLACGFHLVPNTELPALLGCSIAGGHVATNELLETSIPGVYCAGEPTGIGGVELALLEGEIAALAASGQVARARKLARHRRRKLAFVRALDHACTLDPRLRTLPADETLVCRCEDVPYSALCARSNWREAKLHTRCGMGPCQGRICGTAAEFLFGWNSGSVRPPIFPALVSSLVSSGASPETLAAAIPLAHHSPAQNSKENR